jgi:RNA polymerase sigma factor (sigma-70 family)
MGNAELPSTRLSLLLGLNDEKAREAAWRTFLRRYKPVIERWCRGRNLQPTDIDEVAETVVVKLFESIQTYDPARGRFRSWLKAVVNNAVSNELRRRACRPGDVARGSDSAADALQAVPEPADDLARELDEKIDRDLQSALADVQGRVEPHEWEAFRRKVMEGKAAEEVATQLGLARSAVYKAVHRVRLLIRQAYAHLQSGV